MFSKKAVIGGLVVMAVLAGGVVLAQAGHDHDHGGGGEPAISRLQLKDGKKWQTDAALRDGMSAIRGDVAAAVKSVHSGKYTPAQYEALGAGIEKKVQSIIANCKLPADADAQLHFVIADVFAGTKEMKSGENRKAGIVKVVEALDAYGKYFDHAGWKNLH